MKAAQINEYGHADVVKVNEIDKPQAGKGQVLVEVQAASLNPFDTMVREGYLQEAIPLDLPVTLGGDIAGVVREVGEDVEGLAEGDIVYGQANVVAGNSGAFAEYAATKAEQVAKAPVGIDITQAASLPLVGVSALQALTDHINLQADQKIFIHGGAGGIGSIAIQIAKSIGAYVATTATGDQIAYVKALGADEVIDYKAQDFSESLSSFDAVFDTVGGDDFNKALAILKSGGVAVSMIADADEARTKELEVTAVKQMTHVSSDKLKTLAKLVEDGIVKPNVGKVFELDQIVQAFEARESGEVQGKIIVHL
jgi:NADPH:quinone reductase-like Zn-dependent oxidoreductase